MTSCEMFEQFYFPKLSSVASDTVI